MDSDEYVREGSRLTHILITDRANEPPIGFVLRWDGPLPVRLREWEVCNGQPVLSYGSPFFGKAKPKRPGFVIRVGGDGSLLEHIAMEVHRAENNLPPLQGPGGETSG